jgi:hypothetical protein
MRNKALSQLGFGEVNPIVVPRLIVGIEGLEKQGKSHFALTAPGPTAYFSSDVGLEGVISKFAPNKSVYVMEMEVPDVKDKAELVWNKYLKAYQEVLALPLSTIRSVVVDTATELWELLRMKEFGKLTQVMPHHYGPVNAKYRAMIRMAYDSKKNLILLHKMKSKYINDKRTADYERAGFADTGFLVQVNAQVYRDPPWVDEDGVQNPGDFNLYIRDCRQNPDMAGVTLTGDMCNFPVLASLVLPEVDMGEWGM